LARRGLSGGTGRIRFGLSNWAGSVWTVGLAQVGSDWIVKCVWHGVVRIGMSDRVGVDSRRRIGSDWHGLD